jgi:adenosylmethionine-8-amino-7-oxononanoate aminotransferase
LFATTKPDPYSSQINFAGKVAQAALERGVLVYPVQGCVDGECGDHILIAPPAVISRDQIAWACEELASVIDDVSMSL